MTPNASLIGYSSMAGGNTLSDETGSFTAPGSKSETTSYAESVGIPDVKESPPPVPVGTDPDRNADRTTYSASPAAWHMMQGNGFSKEST